MTRLGLICGVLALMAAPGCSVCCTPFDDAYPGYGGKWERTDRFHGRVGSAFHPAGPFPGEVTGTVDGAEVLEAPTPATPPIGEPTLADEATIGEAETVVEE
jgi:hypothetical protein